MHTALVVLFGRSHTFIVYIILNFCCEKGGCVDNISQGFLSDSDMGTGTINPDFNISQF